MSSPYYVRDRIDSFPTETIAGYGVRAGRSMPFGATLVPGGVNFSIYSGRATGLTLVLFRRGEEQPMAELPIPEAYRIGGVWAMTVFGLDYEDVEYGYRVTGPDRPNPGDRFDPARIVSDPYARNLGGRDSWGEVPDWTRAYMHRSRLAFDDFDWDGDYPLRIAPDDLVVYEAHLRGFTRHPNSGVANPGTYAGLVEKIPYLRSLGVNCVELMPVFEFDEWENSRINEETGERLFNYWGYSTVGFFAPKAGFAATGPLGMQCDEFKNLVRELHRAGIEVMLDVVFNHTAEGNEYGPTISFRGLDNSTYYMLTPEGYYYNFSGTGNSFNANNPVVRDFILNCLRYWASEYHIDGFRFDLAAILGRDQNGAPLPNPPLLEALAYDPVLRDCKLVAEAWDAGGLYEVGSFPNYQRWSEWNGKYRDCVRKFLKGEAGTIGELATRVAGSPDLYKHRGCHASVNFVTCHDGFTLNDLVSYDGKHNDANGEHNNDGSNDNDSWNCGVEGPTDSTDVLRLRTRQMKNAFALLLNSRGIPMVLAGDEVARTQGGNNNAYCHDSELSWFDWSLVEGNAELLRFARNMIGFRARHAVLRCPHHPQGSPPAGSPYPEISWHGVYPWSPDWSAESRLLGFMWYGHGLGDGGTDDVVYVVANSHWEPHQVMPPSLPAGWWWELTADTGADSPRDFHAAGEGPPVGSSIAVGPRSTLVLTGRRVDVAASAGNAPAATEQETVR